MSTEFQSLQIVEKSKKEQLRVYFSEFKGKKLFNVRSFFFNDEEEDFVPSSKGITLPAKDAEFLLEAIEDCIDQQAKKVKKKKV